MKQSIRDLLSGVVSKLTKKKASQKRQAGRVQASGHEVPKKAMVQQHLSTQRQRPPHRPKPVSNFDRASNM